MQKNNINGLNWFYDKTLPQTDPNDLLKFQNTYTDKQLLNSHENVGPY